MSEIRNCTREDIPAVAALFQKTFRDPAQKAPAALEDYLAEVHFDHPWRDAEIAPRIHLNGDGRLTGFVGVFPGRIEHRGRTFRAAIAGSLMVDNRDQDPLAGAKLLRSVIKGPQDISISETTNLLSQSLWERVGGEVVPLLSLDWLRVFRPGAAGLSLLTARRPRAAMLAPIAGLGDRIGSAWTRRYLKPAEAPKRLSIDAAPSAHDFAAAVFELASSIELRPAWTTEDIAWFLAHAARKERYGPAHRSIVRDSKGALVGCYIYHGKPGDTGRLLQALARKGAAGDVLDCLFHEAAEAGLAALRGRSSPQLVNALLTRNCIFVHRASTAIHSANGDLSAAVMAGDALITGLAGESWTRLVGGEFG